LSGVGQLDHRDVKYTAEKCFLYFKMNTTEDAVILKLVLHF